MTPISSSRRSLNFFVVVLLFALQVVVPALCAECDLRHVFSFGFNGDGQLGIGVDSRSTVPVAVDKSGVLNGKTIAKISSGWIHSLVLSSTGQVFSFGSNDNGQLGDGTNTDRNTPVAVDTSGVLNGLSIFDIVAGDAHSLVLSSTGQVFAFGLNDNGQLGDGTSDSRTIPVAVNTSGVLNGLEITAVAAGSKHSLVLASTGQVFAFGLGYWGQLGDGTSETRKNPVAVSTSGVLSGKAITAIACGGYHSLVLSSSGQVFSFGDNSFGQLGDGTNTHRITPVAVNTSGVLNGLEITAISAGSLHSLVLSSTGQVFSFGFNNDGQLGDGTLINGISPVAVLTSGFLEGKTITAIAAGQFHSLVVSSTGQVFGFGKNDKGQLGDGTSTYYSQIVPVPVVSSGILNGKVITALSGGNAHSLVLSSTGQAFSFGDNYNGQLGDGSNTKVNPVAISKSGVLNGVTIIALSGGTGHSLVLSSTGQAFAFGNNLYGQLGDGSTTSSIVPVAVSKSGVLNGLTIIAISGGGAHSLVLSSTGQVFAFGNNLYGQLGDGTTTDRWFPVAVFAPGVLNGKTITAISGGGAHSLVLSSTGQAFSFGYNGYGQLGDGTNTFRNLPVAVSTSGVLNGKNITAISTGYCHSLVLSSTGQVFSFGWNDDGQLGDGTNTFRNLPVAVSTSGVLNGKTITAISAGYEHSLALSSTGQVFSFGSNKNGQLGDGSPMGSNVPVAVWTSGVLNGKTITAISAGSGHSLVLSSTGQVSSFGQNDKSQLGDGSTTTRYVPVEVSTSGDLRGKTAIAISAGQVHSMVLSMIFSNVTIESALPYLFVGQSNVSISWCGPGNVKIELIRDGSGTIDTIAENWEGGSPFVWSSVSTSDARRSDFRFKISSPTSPNIPPATSNPFEIDTFQKKISSVNGPSSYLVAGQSNVSIIWTSSGYLGNVTIELIRDGSGTTDTIVENWEGGSPFVLAIVSVSDARRTDFRFRVKSTTYSSVSPTTSNAFEIETVEKNITSVSTPPSNLVVGQSNVSISWTLSGYLGNVKIELIRDGDGLVDTITSNWEGGSPFVWISVSASDAPRSDYRFRLSSVTYPNVSSTTSDTFRVDTPAMSSSHQISSEKSSSSLISSEHSSSHQISSEFSSSNSTFLQSSSNHNPEVSSSPHLGVGFGVVPMIAMAVAYLLL